MKKYLKNILFLTILAAAVIIPGFFMTSKFMTKYHLANGKGAVSEKLAVEQKDTIDVIVAGDSESYTTISPMQIWKKYGYTVYAAGQPGAKLTETKYILSRAFKTQSPKVVMLETNSLYRCQNTQSEVSTKTSEFLYKHLPLLRLHSAWKSPLMELRGKTYKGFLVSGKVRPYKGKTNYMKKTGEVAYIDENNINTLREIKDLCLKNGAKLMLYSAPSPKNYNYKKHNAIVKLAKEENLTYLDMNMHVKEMGINWKTDTRDKGDHLNYSGAIKSTKFIGKYMNEKFEIPDRRNTQVAFQWDKLHKKYAHSGKRALKRTDRKVKLLLLKRKMN